MPPVCLMVAEKPAICNAIANGLSGGAMESRGRTPPIHEFEGDFRGERVLFRVTSVVGHMFSLDFPKQYQSWEGTDPASLFDAPTQRKCESKGVFAMLQRESKRARYLVLWLDCDREGENICFEVMDTVLPHMQRTSGQQVFRAKFSAVTPKDIGQAMRTLGEPNLHESQAVDARQELDLKVGVAMSRHFTTYFHGKYGDLDSSLVSYGPCQTPTLAFCVNRHDEIQTFKSEPYWVVRVQAEPPGGSGGAALDLEWERSRVFDREAADVLLHLVSADGTLACVRSTEGHSKRPRPQPMNTVAMLKAASKVLGLGPQRTMRIAEDLYLRGMLSYPRTESTAYPSSFDFREAVEELSRAGGQLGGYSDRLLRDGIQRPRSGVDMGDHPPITPVRAARGDVLDSDAMRLYSLVARHFLASISADAVFLTQRVEFTCGGERFKASGSQIVSPGWMEVQLGLEAEAQRAIPSYAEGDRVPVRALRLSEGLTSPPGYLTESELIGLMERHGIGTDASIATHINNIQTRNYVSLGGGRTLTPTPLGVVLIHGLGGVDGELVAPRVRANIENNCTLVAQGKADKDIVVAHALENFKRKFAYLCENMYRMDALFECTFSPLAQAGKLLSKCGSCTRLMRLVESGRTRLHCGNCDRTYGLPGSGTVKLLSGQYCPLDGFELVLFSLGNSSKALGEMYPVCPKCYSDTGDQENDGDEGSSAGVSCLQCVHPSCSHSSASLGVCDCPGSCGGKMVLNEYSKPHWRISCSTPDCNLIIRIHQEPKAVRVLDEHCTCGSRKLRVTFRSERNPLDDGRTVHEGCLVCDDLVNSLTEVVEGRTKNLQLIRQERAKRRARSGRGGRGRRGRRPRDPKMSFSDW